MRTATRRRKTGRTQSSSSFPAIDLYVAAVQDPINHRDVIDLKDCNLIVVVSFRHAVAARGEQNGIGWVEIGLGFRFMIYTGEESFDLSAMDDIRAGSLNEFPTQDVENESRLLFTLKLLQQANIHSGSVVRHSRTTWTVSPARLVGSEIDKHD